MNVLEQALKATQEERMQDYGKPADNMAHVARIASAIADKEFTAQDVVVLNIAQKLSRQMHLPKPDNLVDLAGYSWVWSQLNNGHDACDKAPPALVSPGEPEPDREPETTKLHSRKLSPIMVALKSQDPKLAAIIDKPAKKRTASEQNTLKRAYQNEWLKRKKGQSDAAWTCNRSNGHERNRAGMQHSKSRGGNPIHRRLHAAT